MGGVLKNFWKSHNKLRGLIDGGVEWEKFCWYWPKWIKVKESGSQILNSSFDIQNLASNKQIQQN